MPYLGGPVISTSKCPEGRPCTETNMHLNIWSVKLTVLHSPATLRHMSEMGTKKNESKLLPVTTVTRTIWDWRETVYLHYNKCRVFICRPQANRRSTRSRRIELFRGINFDNHGILSRERQIHGSRRFAINVIPSKGEMVSMSSYYERLKRSSDSHTSMCGICRAKSLETKSREEIRSFMPVGYIIYAPEYRRNMVEYENCSKEGDGEP